MDDSLLYRDLRGETNPTEQHAVAVWRRASPPHEARYQELRTLATATARARFPASDPPPVLEVLETAARREAERGRQRRTRRLLGAAAGVAAVLIAGVALDRSGMLGARMERDFGFEEMVTGDSQSVTVSLRDGSVMRLAPQSRARIRVRDGSREVHLTGRAFFSVSRRNGLPFTVRTTGGDVTVLGTQFDLDATGSDVRLVVVEGKVALTGARGGEAQVVRGQEARVVDGQLLPQVAAVEARQATRWVGRFLAFQAAPLTEVAAEIERAYDVRVTIADSLLAQQSVTNWFSDRLLDDVVRVVCAIVAAECTIDGPVVTIGRSPQP